MHRGIVIAAGSLAAVVLLALLWASGSGTTVLHEPSGRVQVTPEPPEPPAPQNHGDQEAVTSLGETVQQISPGIDWFLVLFGLAVLAIIVRLVRWMLHRTWEEGEPPPEEEELGEDLDLLLEATSQAARSTALAEGEPRNVVVRCWVALEDAAAASGLARDPAETAAEFTARFLGRWQVEARLTQELAELYREARFSRRPVTSASGERAVHLVSRIHEQLLVSNGAPR